MGINSTPAADFIKFVNNSPSPFHAVEEAINRLEEAGYKELKERDNWKGKLKNEGKYYFTRNKSTIVAFAIGGKYEPGNGFSMAGAHTDSPCLKVKPISKKEKEGYLQVGVEPYGGGLWHTWFDRDLSVAGRVMVKTEDKFEHKLVNVERPILRIPTLAIHLDRDVREKFKFNNETHLAPLIATASKALTGNNKSNEKKDVNESNEKHHPILLDLLVQSLNCNVNEIHDFELCLYDTHPSTIGGACNEFIFSARLDNLIMSYTILTGLINTTKDTSKSLCNDPNIRLMTLFDNEEIGSTTAHGANSGLLETTLRRICSGCNNKTGYDTIFEETIHKSFMISADMAHAVHPNYCERYEENHRPRMNKGIVIKNNANQRYATTSATSLILKQVAKKCNVPLQEFVVRGDLPCGSTIGPMISANLGLRTVDIGNPQLSMHSIRETAGTDDVDYAIKLFQGFFENFAEIDQNITVD